MSEQLRLRVRFSGDFIECIGHRICPLSPRSSFRGIHDSLVNYSKCRPEILLCQHEEISVAIAHGYGVAAGKPMAAITHDMWGCSTPPWRSTTLGAIEHRWFCSAAAGPWT